MNTQVFPPQPVFAHIQSPYSHVNQSAHVHLFEIVVYKDKSLSQCILMDTTKDATKPRKIPWPANIYILLENSRIRNLEMSMMSVKKNPKQNFGLLEYFNPCGDFKKAFLIYAHPHASSKTSMKQNNFKQIMTALWDWKSSDKSAHYITLKQCIRQWITFPYVFRNGLEYLHMQTHTHSCLYTCRVHQ